MNQQPVVFEREENVGYVLLHAPPLHVLNIDALAALDRAAGEAAESRVPVVVVRARGGKCFSAGVDIRDHTSDKIALMLDRFHGALWRFHTMRAATVAVLDGPALGGGAELALVCDMVLASEKADIAFPEINVACFPPVAMALLATGVGHHRAAEMILTGKRISARAAHAMGLVNAVSDDAEMLLKETLAAFSDKSPSVLGLTARGVRKMRDAAFEEALREAERLYKEDLARLPDMEEGVRAFMEKRKPVWRDPASNAPPRAP